MALRTSTHVHLLRMAGLFVSGSRPSWCCAGLMVPADFGELGHYRSGAVLDNMNRPRVFAGQAACVECHADVAELRAKGRHARVACESCHGALAGHAANPAEVKPVRPDARYHLHRLPHRQHLEAEVFPAGRARRARARGLVRRVPRGPQPEDLLTRPRHGPGSTDISRADGQAARPDGVGRRRVGARAGGPAGRGPELPRHGPLVGRWSIDIEKCIGCGNCVRACKTENDVPREPYTSAPGSSATSCEPDDLEHPQVDSPNGGYDGFHEQSRRGDPDSKTFFVPKLCNHCAHSPCVQVCPVGATFESPDGVVLVDKSYCLGCRYCVQACPYGCRFIDPRTQHRRQVHALLPPDHEGADDGLLRDLPDRARACSAT